MAQAIRIIQEKGVQFDILDINMLSGWAQG